MRWWFQRKGRKDESEAVDARAAESFPEPTPGAGRLDRLPDPAFRFEREELDFLLRVDEAAAREELDLPHLESTHMRLLELTRRPEIDTARVVKLVEPDLALTTALLRAANSVLFGGRRPIQTVREATLRLGARGLRSVLLALSLRSVVFRVRGLDDDAREVWRQAAGCAAAARALSLVSGRDPERGFVVGLLHDVGRAPLLHLLARFSLPAVPRPPVVALAMHRLHEGLGGRLLSAWGLPDDIVAVARRHHDVPEDGPHARDAALVRLAHEIDRSLALGEVERLEALDGAEEFDRVGIAEGERHEALRLCREHWLAASA